MDIGESHITSAESEGDPFVIHAEQVQHRGVQVMNFDTVFNDLVSKFVGLSVNRAAADTASRQPHRKAKRIVITSITPLCKGRQRFPRFYPPIQEIKILAAMCFKWNEPWLPGLTFHRVYEKNQLFPPEENK